MVTDWFAGKEIATAMGIFVSSGQSDCIRTLRIAGVAVGWGLTASYLLILGMLVAGTGLLTALYYSPSAQAVGPALGTWPAGAAAGCHSRRWRLGLLQRSPRYDFLQDDPAR